VCTVQAGEDSLVKEAKRPKQRKQALTVGELVVCLGYSKITPGSYRFFIASGTFVDRSTFDLSTAIPFHFDRRAQPPHQPQLLPLAPPLAPTITAASSNPVPDPGGLSPVVSTRVVDGSLSESIAPTTTTPTIQPAAAPPLRDPTEQIFPISHIMSYTGNPKRTTL